MSFDTLEYIHKLKACGVPEDQAEVHARAIIEVMESNLASKQDIAEIKRDMTGLKRDMQEMEINLKRDMKELETGLKCDMKELELRLKHDLTLRLGGMMAASVALMAALARLL